MKASQVKEVVRRAINSPTEMAPAFLWGGPGIYKSSVVKQSAEEEEVDCIDIRLLLLDPTDLRGIPVPEDGKAKWLPPSFLPREGRGVIFFDELNAAPPLVQNSALQLVLDRRLGEYKLPDGWAIVAAGNREMEAFVHRMSPPLLNRFLHIDCDVDNEEWTKWAVRSDVDPRIIGLLGEGAGISGFRPELLYQFDPKKKAFPTPRSWEFVSKVIKNGFPEALQFELVKGCVGEGAAIELNTYLKIWSELPDLDEILRGRDIIPESIDLIYACVVGLVSKAKTQKNYDRLLEYSLKLEREFTMFMVKMLYQKDKEKVVKSDKWSELSKTVVRVDKLLE